LSSKIEKNREKNAALLPPKRAPETRPVLPKTAGLRAGAEKTTITRKKTHKKPEQKKGFFISL
jgi:hypothetical protein